MEKSTSSSSTEPRHPGPTNGWQPGWPVSVLLVAGGLALGILISPFASRIMPGSAEADLDEVSNCLELARAFGDYPLLFAGADILGYELRGCRHSKTPDRYTADGTRYHVATDFFTFVYGQCQIREGSSSCPIPVAIVIHPSCDPAAEGPLTEGQLTVRGAPIGVREDGSIEVSAAGYRAEVYAPGTTRDEQFSNAISVADALVGVNQKAAAIGPNDLLSDGIEPSAACP